MAPEAHLIAVTMGDPSGVGAEVIVQALAELPPDRRARFVVVGDGAVLGRAASACRVDLGFRPLDGPVTDGAVALREVVVDGLPDSFGVLSPRCGEASYRYIREAVAMALEGRVAGIVTAPINKAALNAAGHHFDGHTGLLAALTGAATSFMLLASERLNVIHVSTHVSLRDAIGRARPRRVLETVRAGWRHLHRLGLQAPRIAVAGINPHCGEGGLFGDEDDMFIRPGVAMAQAEGMGAVGPVPADTAYHRAYEGEFDLVVAPYHDQGHIPIKLVAFDSAVNVSLGLPIDRVSVDHGTAFDIAGRGTAKSINMLAALDYAERLARTPRSATSLAARG